MWERIALDAWSVALSVLASAIFVGLGFVWAWRKVRRTVRREWQGELEKVRQEGRQEGIDQAQALALELAQYQAAQAKALEVVATTLRQTTREQYEAMAVVTNKLDHLVLVSDVLALGIVRLEKLLLNQVKLLATRAMHAAAIVTAQEVKELLAKDLTGARTQIEDLHLQLAEARAAKEG